MIAASLTETKQKRNEYEIESIIRAVEEETKATGDEAVQHMRGQVFDCDSPQRPITPTGPEICIKLP